MLSELKVGDTVKVERYDQVINGRVQTVNGVDTIVGRRNDTNYVTHLQVRHAIKYGWKLCKI